MMLITGSACGADPATALSLALTGPNDQRRDPADKNQPDYQHEDHSSILLSASSEGPVYSRAFPFLKLRWLRAGTRFFTFQGKLNE
jgi:hypothetical protein